MLTELILESTPNPVATSQISLLHRLYGCRKGLAVWEFVASHPFLISVLEEVHQRVSDFFPPHPVWFWKLRRLRKRLILAFYSLSFKQIFLSKKHCASLIASMKNGGWKLQTAQMVCSASMWSAYEL